jgi:signal transduction histidine kinase
MLKWQVAMMLATWIVLVGWLFHTMTGYEHGDLDQRMKYFAGILAETASGSPADPELLAGRMQATERIYVEGVIQQLESAGDYTATYQVFDRSGNLLYRTQGAPAVALTTTSGLSRGTRDDGGAWRYARTQSSDGTTVVVVGEAESGRWASILPMLEIIGGAQIAILAITLLATWIAARQGLKPLQSLAEQIGRREAGDLSPIQAPVMYAETRPIVLELNALLDRESRRLENERGFLADAAHELRTPLAAIGTDAHLVLSAGNGVERMGAYANLNSGLERVSHLLEQLLTIARVEAPGGLASREPTDLATLVRDRVAEHASRARQRAVSIELDAPDQLIAQVSRSGLVSIVDNLVDNAIRYAPSGGHVAVTVRSREKGIELIVQDDGPGIPEHERERVFERFYRLPGSTPSGTGLGLAIVRRVAQAHKARIRFVEGLSGTGIGVLVRLPA